jgi:N-acetylglutamate synthase-like GNAT family acetyltransferase
MAHELSKVTSESDWRDYHSLRRKILWEAKGRIGYDETHRDEFLEPNHPLLLKLYGRSIGTTRLDDFNDGTGAVRLVTIAIDVQGRGHGRVLSELVENYARRLGLTTLFVNAAPEAVGYYEKLGWEHYSWNPAELIGIAANCKQMRKVLLHGP